MNKNRNKIIKLEKLFKNELLNTQQCIANRNYEGAAKSRDEQRHIRIQIENLGRFILKRRVLFEKYKQTELDRIFQSALNELRIFVR